MLSPAQVIPFLTHNDYAVRYHAAKFLADAHDPAPATADDFWRAIDLHGMMRDEFTFEGGLTHLAAVPCTDAALTRLLQEIAARPAALCMLHLTQALDDLPFDLLRARWEDISSSAGIPDDSKKHLETRLDLASRPLELLWDELMEHAASVSEKNWGEFDGSVSVRLIEALARHPEPFGPRALETLSDESVIDWREPFCLDLVGEMRYEPALDILLEKLREEDGQNDLAREALVRIGTVDVIRRVAELFPHEGSDFRLPATGVFGDIKRPESEAAVLALLPGEEDDQIQTFLAMALCDLCSREGVEVVRRMAIDGRIDESVFEPEELILTVGQMVGYEPPEAAKWRKLVARREAELRQTRARMAHLTAENDSALKATEKPKPPRPLPDFEPAPVPEQRDVPRVGRNDPCPCGSGKKYKKCCLKQEATR